MCVDGLHNSALLCSDCLSFPLVRLIFNIGDGSGDDEYLLPQVLSLSTTGMSVFIWVTYNCDDCLCAFADYMRHAIARVFTVVSVIELFSSSLHERALTRLAVAHDLVSPGEHSSCRDWFECLLRTKAALSQQECPSQVSGELNYFNGISLLNF